MLDFKEWLKMVFSFERGAINLRNDKNITKRPYNAL